MRRIVAIRAGWDDRLIKRTLSAVDDPELPPPIWRGWGGLERLSSERHLQQIAQ